jgi:cytoskeletal protein RodZ
MKPLLLSVLSTIAVILGVVGLGVLVWGFLRMRQTARTKNWPTTQGTIRSSTVTSREAPPLRQEESYDDDAPKPKPQVLYRPRVEYTYTVDGQTYTGTALGRDMVEVSSSQHAKTHAARYVPRAPVTVFYDPNDPSQALLEPGVQATSWAIPGAGAACLIVTTAFYFFIRWFSGR